MKKNSRRLPKKYETLQSLRQHVTPSLLIYIPSLGNIDIFIPSFLVSLNIRNFTIAVFNVQYGPSNSQAAFYNSLSDVSTFEFGASCTRKKPADQRDKRRPSKQEESAFVRRNKSVSLRAHLLPRMHGAWRLLVLFRYNATYGSNASVRAPKGAQLSFPSMTGHALSHYSSANTRCYTVTWYFLHLKGYRGILKATNKALLSTFFSLWESHVVRFF